MSDLLWGAGIALLYLAFERTRSLVVWYVESARLIPPTSPQEVDAIPSDLASIAILQSEPWAQQDMLKAMRELHSEVGDWNTVRLKFGVSEREG